MEKEKPRLARLTAILTQLQSKSLVTARDIAEKHQISIRTVYRDIRTLEKSGIPIVTEEGRGYSIMEGYKVPPVMFTEHEANAIITAYHIIKKNKDRSLIDNYSAAVEKIRSVLKSNQKEKSELLSDRLHIRNNHENEVTSNHVIKIQSAITNNQILDLKYLSLQNKKSQRKIEPFALYSTQDNWIMIAQCQKAMEFRAFRLDCIESLQRTGHTFEPKEMTLDQYFEQRRKIWEKENNP